MIAPEMLTGGIVAIGAFLAGQWLPRPGRRGAQRPKKIEPYCGCEDGDGGFHHHSYHDPKTGECHGKVYIGFWSSQRHYQDCTCRQYSGPQPLPEVYAPEITS